MIYPEMCKWWSVVQSSPQNYKVFGVSAVTAWFEAVQGNKEVPVAPEAASIVASIKAAKPSSVLVLRDPWDGTSGMADPDAVYGLYEGSAMGHRLWLAPRLRDTAPEATYKAEAEVPDLPVGSVYCTEFYTGPTYLNIRWSEHTVYTIEHGTAEHAKWALTVTPEEDPYDAEGGFPVGRVDWSAQVDMFRRGTDILLSLVRYGWGETGTQDATYKASMDAVPEGYAPVLRLEPLGEIKDPAFKQMTFYQNAAGAAIREYIYGQGHPAINYRTSYIEEVGLSTLRTYQVNSERLGWQVTWQAEDDTSAATYKADDGVRPDAFSTLSYETMAEYGEPEVVLEWIGDQTVSGTRWVVQYQDGSWMYFHYNGDKISSKGPYDLKREFPTIGPTAGGYARRPIPPRPGTAEATYKASKGVLYGMEGYFNRAEDPENLDNLSTLGQMDLSYIDVTDPKDGDLFAPSALRGGPYMDSGDVEFTNYTVFMERHGHKPGVYSANLGYDSFGVFLRLPVTDPGILADLHALTEYPCLDDDRCYKVEAEWIDHNWQTWAADDFKGDLSRVMDLPEGYEDLEWQDWKAIYRALEEALELDPPYVEGHEAVVFSLGGIILHVKREAVEGTQAAPWSVTEQVYEAVESAIRNKGAAPQPTTYKAGWTMPQTAVPVAKFETIKTPKERWEFYRSPNVVRPTYYDVRICPGQENRYTSWPKAQWESFQESIRNHPEIWREIRGIPEAATYKALKLAEDEGSLDWDEVYDIGDAGSLDWDEVHDIGEPTDVFEWRFWRDFPARDIRWIVGYADGNVCIFGRKGRYNQLVVTGKEWNVWKGAMAGEDGFERVPLPGSATSQSTYKALKLAEAECFDLPGVAPEYIWVLREGDTTHTRQPRTDIYRITPGLLAALAADSRTRMTAQALSGQTLVVDYIVLEWRTDDYAPYVELWNEEKLPEVVRKFDRLPHMERVQEAGTSEATYKAEYTYQKHDKVLYQEEVWEAVSVSNSWSGMSVLIVRKGASGKWDRRWVRPDELEKLPEVETPEEATYKASNLGWYQVCELGTPTALYRREPPLMGDAGTRWMVFYADGMIRWFAGDHFEHQINAIHQSHWAYTDRVLAGEMSHWVPVPLPGHTQEATYKSAVEDGVLLARVDCHGRNGAVAAMEFYRAGDALFQKNVYDEDPAAHCQMESSTYQQPWKAYERLLRFAVEDGYTVTRYDQEANEATYKAAVKLPPDAVPFACFRTIVGNDLYNRVTFYETPDGTWYRKFDKDGTEFVTERSSSRDLDATRARTGDWEEVPLEGDTSEATYKAANPRMEDGLALLQAEGVTPVLKAHDRYGNLRIYGERDGVLWFVCTDVYRKDWGPLESSAYTALDDVRAALLQHEYTLEEIQEDVPASTYKGSLRLAASLGPVIPGTEDFWEWTGEPMAGRHPVTVEYHPLDEDLVEQARQSGDPRAHLLIKNHLRWAESNGYDPGTFFVEIARFEVGHRIDGVGISLKMIDGVGISLKMAEDMPGVRETMLRNPGWTRGGRSGTPEAVYKAQTEVPNPEDAWRRADGRGVILEWAAQNTSIDDGTWYASGTDQRGGAWFFMYFPEPAGWGAARADKGRYPRSWRERGFPVVPFPPRDSSAVPSTYKASMGDRRLKLAQTERVIHLKRAPRDTERDGTTSNLIDDLWLTVDENDIVQESQYTLQGRSGVLPKTNLFRGKNWREWAAAANANRPGLWTVVDDDTPEAATYKGMKLAQAEEAWLPVADPKDGAPGRWVRFEEEEPPIGYRGRLGYVRGDGVALSAWVLWPEGDVAVMSRDRDVVEDTGLGGIYKKEGFLGIDRWWKPESMEAAPEATYKAQADPSFTIDGITISEERPSPEEAYAWMAPVAQMWVWIDTGSDWEYLWVGLRPDGTTVGLRPDGGVDSGSAPADGYLLPESIVYDAVNGGMYWYEVPIPGGAAPEAATYKADFPVESIPSEPGSVFVTRLGPEPSYAISVVLDSGCCRTTRRMLQAEDWPAEAERVLQMPPTEFKALGRPDWTDAVNRQYIADFDDEFVTVLRRGWGDAAPEATYKASFDPALIPTEEGSIFITESSDSWEDGEPSYIVSIIHNGLACMVDTDDWSLEGQLRWAQAETPKTPEEMAAFAVNPGFLLTNTFEDVARLDKAFVQVVRWGFAEDAAQATYKAGIEDCNWSTLPAFLEVQGMSDPVILENSGGRAYILCRFNGKHAKNAASYAYYSRNRGHWGREIQQGSTYEEAMEHYKSVGYTVRPVPIESGADAATYKAEAVTVVDGVTIQGTRLSPEEAYRLMTPVERMWVWTADGDAWFNLWVGLRPDGTTVGLTHDARVVEEAPPDEHGRAPSALVYMAMHQSVPNWHEVPIPPAGAQDATYKAEADGFPWEALPAIIAKHRLTDVVAFRSGFGVSVYGDYTHPDGRTSFMVVYKTFNPDKPLEISTALSDRQSTIANYARHNIPQIPIPGMGDTPEATYKATSDPISWENLPAFLDAAGIQNVVCMQGDDPLQYSVFGERDGKTVHLVCHQKQWYVSHTYLNIRLQDTVNTYRRHKYRVVPLPESITAPEATYKAKKRIPWGPDGPRLRQTVLIDADFTEAKRGIVEKTRGHGDYVVKITEPAELAGIQLIFTEAEMEPAGDPEPPENTYKASTMDLSLPPLSERLARALENTR